MVKLYNSLIFRLNKFKYFILFHILKLKFINTVSHNGINIKFLITNEITDYRAKSFAYKEPKTLKWINSFENNKCFWDIGSNVGVYSIYSKLINNSLNVISFEPSFKNLNILSENLKLNKISKEITVFSLPISNTQSINDFILGDDVDGGANSSLYPVNYNEKLYQNSYRTMSISIDTLITSFNLPRPYYIKIDVDGNEMNILKGINNYYNDIKEILVEVDNYKTNLNYLEKFLNNKNFFISDIETYDVNNNTANILFKRQ